MTTTFSFLGLLPRTDRDKEIEILVLRHQLMVLQRQAAKPVFTPADRLLLAGLLHRLPTDKLRHLVLLVRPDTILRWHRDLLRRRASSQYTPTREGSSRSRRSVRPVSSSTASTSSNGTYWVSSPRWPGAKTPEATWMELVRVVMADLSRTGPLEEG